MTERIDDSITCERSVLPAPDGHAILIDRWCHQRKTPRAIAMRAVPSDLPILIAGGEQDPVGGAAGMARVGDAWKNTGHTDVTLAIYPQGRHEMLNETNRNEFTADVLAWLKSSAGKFVRGAPALVL